MKSIQSRQITRSIVGAASVVLTVALSGCKAIVTDRYEATATTTYTWHVYYADNPDRKRERVEEFASASLVNRNGLKPEQPASYQDDQGLWWPPIPPRPTVEEIEAHQQRGETPSDPEIHTSVDYQITYELGDRQVSKPTNYQVYRQVAKRYPEQPPLEFTLSPNESSVEKAEPFQ